MAPNYRRTRRTSTDLYDSDLSWAPPEPDDLFLMRLEDALLDRIDARIDARLGAPKAPSRRSRRHGRRLALMVGSVAALVVTLQAIGQASVQNDGPASADQRIIRNRDIFGRNSIEINLGKPLPPLEPKRPEEPIRPSP